MATSYREIYDRALGRIDSYTLTNAVMTNPIYYYQMMYPYLLTAFGQITTPSDLLICLQYRKEPEYKIEDFKGDGIKQNYELSFDIEVDSIPNIYFKVVINDAELIEGVDYTYNQVTNSIDFTAIPSEDANIAIHYYYIGEIVGTYDNGINVELTDFAKQIISSYVVTNWKEKIYNKETHMKGLFSPKEYNQFSPANLLKEIKSSLEHASELAYSEQKDLGWRIRYMQQAGINHNLIATRTLK